MDSSSRPLSPHLQIYRWQLTMALSITHRATGIALAVGSVLLVWWLLAAAEGGGAFNTAQAFWGSWVGLILLFGWAFALFFHLCNGIRHLAWDTGWGLDLKTTYATGWAVVAASVLLTVIAFVLGFSLKGPA
jgi:succinate dehydrogenase / fumarate reductase cytochrome b subunit